jgi:hypothetical protein
MVRHEVAGVERRVDRGGGVVEDVAQARVRWPVPAMTGAAGIGGGRSLAGAQDAGSSPRGVARGKARRVNVSTSGRGMVRGMN